MTKIILKTGTDEVVVDFDDQAEIVWTDELRTAYEYEVAYAAMGGTRTVLGKFVDGWGTESRAELLCETIGWQLHHKDLARLACDWAEHVLPIFEKHYWKRYQIDPMPRDAIQLVRDYLEGTVKESALLEEGRLMEKLADNWANVSEWVAVDAMNAVVGAVYSAAAGSSESAASEAIIAARSAEGVPAGVAAQGQTLGRVSPGCLAAKASESAWQARHFLHAMECIQAGKPFPKIEETP